MSRWKNWDHGLDKGSGGASAHGGWPELAGLGLFSAPAPSPLTLMPGCVVPDPTLTHLHQRLEALARSFGVDFPRRKFTPHVTLAYLRPADFDLAELHDALARGMSFASEPFMPDTLSLFRVHQGKQGNRYEVVADYSLSNL